MIYKNFGTQKPKPSLESGTDEMRDHIELAIQNIVKHGDTDIFPFPFENHVFFDNKEDSIDLLLEYHKNFDNYLNLYPPRPVNSLAPAGYTGFRWATQLDPIWNAYFLACVLSISKAIENKRIPKDQDVVFSYRFVPDLATGDLFDRDYTWPRFMRRSLHMCEEFDHVVICDISEFYPRLGHHRLENALQHIDDASDAPHRIMKFLDRFSNTRSFGLPIGGPAARILSELTLNQIDQILRSQKIEFVRYVDDYHLFSTSRDDAYKQLVFLSEKLQDNQGLSLQKSKTRILSAAEFKSTSPIQDVEDDSGEHDIADIPSPRSLFRFSIAFDPYSPTADEDYQHLKIALRRFDIMGLLRSELQKTRIHAAFSRRIVQAIRFLDDPIRDDAVRSILDNCEVLYPIFSSVLILLDGVIDELSDHTQDLVTKRIRDLIADESYIMRVDLHVAFAIRVLSHRSDDATQALLVQLYNKRTSPLIRKSIILTIARWREWYWLSDLRNRFRQLTEPERDAFLLASYVLRDEGRHWRQHIKDELTPFEKLILNWASQKTQDHSWEIPL